VFLDANVLHTKSADFTKARFAENLEELIGEIEATAKFCNIQ
jgi:hypothetical protein